MQDKQVALNRIYMPAGDGERGHFLHILWFRQLTFSALGKVRSFQLWLLTRLLPLRSSIMKFSTNIPNTSFCSVHSSLWTLLFQKIVRPASSRISQQRKGTTGPSTKAWMGPIFCWMISSVLIDLQNWAESPLSWPAEASEWWGLWALLFNFFFFLYAKAKCNFCLSLSPTLLD